jgi:tellurite resistance protein
MVLLADGRVSARERKKLMDFVNALKISEVHRSIIFEDVERTLH